MRIERDRRRPQVAQDGGDHARLRLLGWPKIIVLAVAIVVAMVLLYPHDTLVEQVSKSTTQDPLSKNYLDNLLKKEPANPWLLVKHAEAQIDAGMEQEAEQLLITLIGQPDAALRVEVAQALVKLRERRFFALAAGDRERERRLAELHQALAVLGDMPLDTKRRETLAQKAATYGAGDLAMRLYRNLADEAGKGMAGYWLGKSAKAALSLGRYREASDLYFEARRQSTEADRRIAHFMAGVRALLAGNMPTEALDAAERELGDLASKPEVLLFMVRTARSADRNDRAEIYVRKLLRYAATGGRPGSLQPVVARGGFLLTQSDSLDLSRAVAACGYGEIDDPCWQRLPGVRPAGSSWQFRNTRQEPRLSFNDEIYRLGYDVFLANRKLADAQAIAEAAVRQAPANTVWRERLAQVAEWNGKPDIALKHWRHLAMTRDSDADWQALLRLAPGLRDEETVVFALLRERRMGRMDDTRMARLVEAFESLGDAQRGIDFLADEYRKRPRRIVLDKKAWLEERAGQVDQTMATLRLIDRKYGLDATQVRRLAGILIAKAKLMDAYELLRRHNVGNAHKDREYQELMSELGWMLQDRAGVRTIYLVLQKEGELADYQAERLIVLLRDDNPAAAAETAVLYWQRHRTPRFLRLAAEIHLRNGRPADAEALLAGLTRDELDAMDEKTEFLMLRAEMRKQCGNTSGAIADLRQAVGRAPTDSSIGAQLLWLLIDTRDRTTLVEELRRQRSHALDRPDLWAPMAAGYVLLAKPSQALPYFAKQAAAHRDDYLWQVNYAQVLEDAGQAEMAWRLRRHVWLKLRKDEGSDHEKLIRLRNMATVASRLAPGDASAKWLRELLKQDVDGELQLSPQAKELATAWYLSNEQQESARIWLAQQYGKQLAAPRWAEVALALQSNDKEELRKIANGTDDEVDLVARVEAAAQLGDYTTVRRLATSGLETDPDRDILHLRLTESRWQLQNRVALAYRNEEFGALQSDGWRADIQWHVTPRLMTSLETSRDELSSNDRSQLTNLPARDARIALGAKLEHDLGETGLKLFRRDALESFSGIELNHRVRPIRRFRVDAQLGRNLVADESAVLKAGGMKNAARVNVEWLIGEREYVGIDISSNRYYGQDRTYLGNGAWLAMQLGYHARIDYPNATLKLMGGSYRFNENDQAASASIRRLLPAGSAVLPGNFNQVGVGVDLGTVIADQYSRNLRPYASLDLLRGSETGWGYGLECGFVFSPTGHDWLRGRYRQGRSAISGGEDARLLEVEYRFIY